LKVYDKNVKKYKNLEIDFIAEKDGKVKYIQVDSSVLDENTRLRELRSLQAIKDNWEKIIVHFDDIDYQELDGIKFMKVEEVEGFMFV